MSLLGHAAIAMWWDISPERKVEFEDWHSHEHLPERLSIAGFRRGSRWAAADGGPGFFVLYELAAHDTLSSPEYLERLNRPTPWSTQLMPHHRHMVRSQCRVVASVGAGIARGMLTLRLSPRAPDRGALRAYLIEQAGRIAARPGTTAAHLLHTEAPDIALTTEQRIRGGRDPSADWIFLAGGYDLAALQALRGGDLSDRELSRHGAADPVQAGVYVLSHALASPEAPGRPAPTVNEDGPAGV
ncbi:MAG TPA: hypothetical protein VLD35_10245 [Caldimonas sp.]|nr:hypothetical protein [Caldimonas sp.]